MTGIVQTVTGPIAADQLGLTLVHEHVVIDMYEVTLNSLVVLTDEAVAQAELGAFRGAGGVSLVDQTTLGLNPDPDALRRISLATGVQIVAGTGVYWHRFRPAWVDDLSEEALEARFVADLTEGMGPGRVRAGLIGEVATGHREIDPVEARVFRAAARAQSETGAPIATHAVFTRIGLVQLDLLESAGADLRAVLIGHADTCSDPTYHLEVLGRGAWLGFDTIGQTDKNSDDWRADRLRELADTGQLEQILISSDVCKRPALRRYGGGGYAQVITDFVPRLLARGFTDADIRQLLVTNPARFLSGTTAAA